MSTAIDKNRYVSFADASEVPAWSNGTYLSLKDVKISPLDRGFLFADGVYEVVPIYAGHLFQWSLHQERLQRSLAGLLFESGEVDLAVVTQAAKTLAQKCHNKHASLYIQITRGCQTKRDHNFPERVTPTIVMWLTTLPEFCLDPPTIRLKSYTDIRWQWRHLKTVSLLGNILLRRQAMLAGFDDALLIESGCVLECSAANYIFIRDKKVFIPDGSESMLPGITRRVLVQLVEQAKLAHEIIDPPPLAEVCQADEVWACSSTRLMLPIAEIDDHVLKDHQKSGVGLQLNRSFLALIENYQPEAS